MSEDGISKEPMLEMYLFEGNQLVEQLEDIIIKCEKDKRFEMGAINEIFRIMHTVKGSSAMMMFNHIGSVAHSMEDLFFFIRANQNIQLNFARLSDLVLSGIDFIKAEMHKIEQGHAIHIQGVHILWRKLFTLDDHGIVALRQHSLIFYQDTISSI